MHRVMVMVVVCALAASACYRRRNIVVPPTEHGQFCVNDANMSYQLCVMQQRGVPFCQERRDRELLMCEGAYEVLADGSSDAGETKTYELPGY